MYGDYTPSTSVRARLCTFALVALVATAPIAAAAEAPDVEQILRDFAEDFERDAFAAEPQTFAVRVEGAEPAEWTIAVGPPEGPDRVASVRVTAGLPAQPAPVFVTNRETLARIHRGDLHGLTAAAKAKSSDTAPLDLDVMPGFEVDQRVIARLIPLFFHFWTRGTPELIPWGRPELSRVVHGANAGIFYYQPGFRSGWFYMTKGQHANQDESEQTNPFPTLVIGVSGSAQSLIGGRPVTIRGGEAVLIPAGVSHEFWNENDEPAVGILLMFGEGA